MHRRWSGQCHLSPTQLTDSAQNPGTGTQGNALSRHTLRASLVTEPLGLLERQPMQELENPGSDSGPSLTCYVTLGKPFNLPRPLLLHV